MGRGLIPGTIWKISCHNLFITYFTLTFSKHWLLYCKKDIWIETRFETKTFASWTKATLLRIYFRNLSVHISFLQYKSQCLEKVNVKYVIKRLWHEIFHMVPGINPRPISALQPRCTNCENKSLRELPLFNLQMFLFRIWFQKYTKQCRSVQWR
jgi:hypothetical protein